MKFLIVLQLLLLVGCGSFEAKPYSKRRAAGPRIWWTIVDDADKECVIRGVKNPGPLATIQACTILTFKHECEIITNKNTTMEILGHEVRHCFEGNFHN